MAQSVKERTAVLRTTDVQEMRLLLEAMLADITALRTAFVALTAKMDADFANVTNASVDYASTVNPPALQTTA